MCLAIPAEVVEVYNSREGLVSWSGIRKRVGIELVPGLKPGDWVLVHAGYVIETIEPEEAAASLALFAEMMAMED